MIDLTRALAIDGWMRARELTWIAERAQACQVIIEVGNWKGRSLRAFADHCPGHVYGVDGYLDPHEGTDRAAAELRDRGAEAIAAEREANLRDLIASGRVSLLRASSTEGAARLRRILQGRPLADLVFIDADHTVEGCRQDIAAYHDLVRPGGLMAGHDYGERAHPGVAVAVGEAFGDRVRRGAGTIWWVAIP